MTPTIYLVVVMLTFADGSYVQYNDGKWVSKPTFNECIAEIKREAQELRTTYTGRDPKPSTFITGCILKEEKKDGG